METSSIFAKNVSDWLNLAGFNFSYQSAGDDLFCLIKVSNDKGYVLLLKLIDLHLWASENSKAERELLTFYQNQGALRDRGLSVVVLWQDVWISQSEIVKSRISAILGISQRIPGRVTFVKKIDKALSSNFMDKNHLQGDVSSRIRYGLFLPKRYFRVLDPNCQIDNGIEELLVAVATFSHPRTFERSGNSFRSFELIRFANLKNTTVVGGFDKLIRAFTEDYKPGDIMTYADLEWSDGSSYKRLGFDLISERSGMQVWLDPERNVRYSENRKPEDVKLMKIYNAGSLKFVKTIS